MQPYWLTHAMAYLGVKEIKGELHETQILTWWKRIKQKFVDDETPWCAAFVGGILEICCIKSTRSALARSYSNWGEELKEPVVGAIVVFWRGSPQGWSGHVGFVVGRDQDYNLMVLGGNQNDEVNIKPFAVDRVLSYRWPTSKPVPPYYYGLVRLPIVNSDGRLSTNEE